LDRWPFPELALMSGENVGAERQIKNSFIYLLTMAATSLVPLVTLPIFTRILTEEDYGVWALAIAFGGLLAGFANLGLLLSFERTFFEMESDEERPGLLYSILAFVLPALGVFGGITWWYRARISDFFTTTPAHGDVFFWAFCATGVTSLNGYYFTYLKNSKDARLHSVHTMADRVLYAVVSLVFVAYLRLGPLGLVLGQLVAGGCVLASLMWRVLPRGPVKFSRRLLAESLKLSYPLTPRLLLRGVVSQFDKYVISLLGTLGGVGVYAVGQQVARMAFTLSTALENVFAPETYERMFQHSRGAPETVGPYLTPFAFLSIGMALLIALFAEEFVHIFSPPIYHSAIPIVSVLAVFYGLQFFGKQPQLVFAKKTWIISVLAFVGLALNASFIVLGVQFLGALGAALGTLGAGIVSVLLFQLLGQRYYTIRWEYSRVLTMLGFLFGATMLILISQALDIPYAQRIAMKVVLCGLYGVLGMRFDILTRKNIDLIRRAVLPLRTSTVH